MGDMGNIQTDASGKCTKRFATRAITMFGENSVVGRGVVIHESPDDLGKANNSESKSTGNVGMAWACGPIGLAEFWRIPSIP